MFANSLRLRHRKLTFQCSLLQFHVQENNVPSSVTTTQRFLILNYILKADCFLLDLRFENGEHHLGYILGYPPV